MVSAVDIKTFHERPVELRHAFENEVAHLAWGPDVGLVETFTAAAPLYTLIDRKVSWVTGDTWVWEYKGRYQDGVKSNWLNEEAAREREVHPTAAGYITLCGNCTTVRIAGLVHQECQQGRKRKQLPGKRCLGHTR